VAPPRINIALSIAGSDPSGGAGIQADLKTFHQLRVFGQAVITLVTVQNTLGVRRVEIMAADLVIEQIRALLEDFPPHAAKIGALGNAGVVRGVAECSLDFAFPLVVDPVMSSKHGAPLLASDAIDALRTALLPHAALVMPNLAEAEALAGRPVGTLGQMRDAARALVDFGAGAALVKGGHLEGDAIDVLFDGSSFHEFASARIETSHTHGTGCTYSAAVTAGLASGLPLLDSVARAKHFVTRAIQSNPGLGHGQGPLNHWEIY
jgi:hydroxymethylpyrimidine/phosphomethylpyrimidine kinase